MKDEQARLDHQVAQQNISAEEVVKMNTEGANLDKMLLELKGKSREANKAATTLEVDVTKRSDFVEQALSDYMALVYKLNLDDQEENPTGISFQLELNGAASEPRHLIQGENIKETIKPAILAISEEKRKKRGLCNDERVMLDNDLDVVTVECENLEQEIETGESRVRLASSEVDEIREVLAFLP